MQVFLYLFTALFTFELIMRIAAEGQRFFYSEDWHWNYLEPWSALARRLFFEKSRSNIYTWWAFHCHLCLPGGNSLTYFFNMFQHVAMAIWTVKKIGSTFPGRLLPGPTGAWTWRVPLTLTSQNPMQEWVTPPPTRHLVSLICACNLWEESLTISVTIPARSKPAQRSVWFVKETGKAEPPCPSVVR